MPLVVPGVTSPLTGSNDALSEWQNKLLGKKIGETSDNMTFAKKDLPETHRVLESDSFGTADHKPERLNVHLAKDGTVEKVSHG